MTKSFTAYSGGRPEYAVTISENTATLRQASEKQLEKIIAPAGAPFVVADAFLVGAFFHLPATLLATGATHATLGAIGTQFKGQDLSVSGEAGPRPTSVPQQDAGTSVTTSSGTSEVRMGTLWYDPQTRVVDEFDMPARRFVMRRISNRSSVETLPTSIDSSGPSGIVAGPDGNLWFTESTGGRIGRITTAGAVSEFSTGPGSDSSPEGIAKGPDGNLWFADQSGNRIGRTTTAGAIKEFAMGPATGPAEIVAGPDGNLWFTENQGKQIGRITTAGAITEFGKGLDINSHPAGIAVGPDGNLWFTDDGFNRIGRITTAGVITEFSTGLSANSDPHGIATGPDGNLWFTENQGNRIGRITTTGAITEFSSGLSDKSAPFDIASAGGYLWFTEQVGNRIGRISPTGAITAEFSTGLER